MTQAILNNINKLETASFSFKNDDSKQMTLPEDFNKILDKTTELTNNSDDKKTDTKELSLENTNEEATENSDYEITNTTINEIIKENIQTLSDVITDAVEEIAGETALEGIISAINIIDSEIAENTLAEENDGAESEAEASAEEESETTDETDNDDTIINNEDPTVNKEDLIYPSQLDNAAILALKTTTLNQKIQNESDNTGSEKLNNQSKISKEQNLYKNIDTKTIKEEPASFVSYVREDEEIIESDTHQKDFLSEKIVRGLNIQTLETQSGGKENSGNLMQNQTPQEQVIKAIVRGDIKFDDSAITTFTSTQETVPTEISSTKIVEQIAKQIENMHNNSKVSIILNPERLGKVSLQILNGKEGLSAQFTVTTNEARDLLLKGLDGLKESLLAHGVNVDNINIKLNKTEESQYNPDWTEQEGSNQGNRQGHPQKQKDKEKHFEQMMFDLSNSDKV